MSGEWWQRYVDGAAVEVDPAVFRRKEEWLRRRTLGMVRVVLATVAARIWEDSKADAIAEYQKSDERHLNSCIWIDPGRQSGVACFGGTRVPVDPFMAIVEEAGVDAAKALWPSVTDAHIAAGKLWRERYHEWLRGAR